VRADAVGRRELCGLVGDEAFPGRNGVQVSGYPPEDETGMASVSPWYQVGIMRKVNWTQSRHYLPEVHLTLSNLCVSAALGLLSTLAK
jgi:hypothetical protein